jgi:hypothetical protein
MRQMILIKDFDLKKVPLDYGKISDFFAAHPEQNECNAGDERVQFIVKRSDFEKRNETIRS